MLELKNISFRSNNKLELDDINLTFEMGKTYIIIGEAGSGKSLLMKVLGGIAKPTKGLVLLDGASLYTDSEEQCLKNRIGFIFQDGVFLSNLSIYDNLFLPVRYLCPQYNSEDVETKIEELFIRFHINSEILTKRPADVSYSVKKLLGFIRAFIINPDIFLINMPLFNLDYKDVKTVTTFLNETKIDKKTIIMTTNNKNLIEQLADYVIILNSGKVDFTFSGNEILKTQNTTVKNFIANNIG